ncbi:MAG: glycosyltransferase family 9 protein [Candidatus Omnitrophota bacterium]|nr:glycosyltransferase family 9 protein [Candidatus Omnitrophota bacterium]
MEEEIIINFPTNIGDAVMCLPTLDRLHFNYPYSTITAIASQRTKELLERNNFSNKVILFDKHWSINKKIKFTCSLKGEYDIIVDFKNSLLPFFIGGKRTPFYRAYPKNMHVKDVYIDLVKKIAPKKSETKSEFTLTEEEKMKWDNLKIPKCLFIACTSNALQKRYPYNYLKEAVRGLKKHFPVAILGQENDRNFYNDILSTEGTIDLVGKTKLYELFYLLKKYARLLLCVDSSILHIASYVNVPIVALFGQNSPLKYGPWSDKFSVITNKALPCVPCAKPHCDFDYKCMEIEPKIVIGAVIKMMHQE